MLGSTDTEHFHHRRKFRFTALLQRVRQEQGTSSYVVYSAGLWAGSISHLGGSSWPSLFQLANLRSRLDPGQHWEWRGDTPLVHWEVCPGKGQQAFRPLILNMFSESTRNSGCDWEQSSSRFIAYSMVTDCPALCVPALNWRSRTQEKVLQSPLLHLSEREFVSLYLYLEL